MLVAEVVGVLTDVIDIVLVASIVPVKMAVTLIVNVTTSGVNETIDVAECDFDTTAEPEGVAEVETLDDMRSVRETVTVAVALFDEVVDADNVRVGNEDADEEAELDWERERIGETDVVDDKVKLFVGRQDAVIVGVAVVVFEIRILFEIVPDAETLLDIDVEPVNVDDPRGERDSGGEAVFEKETVGVRVVIGLILSV